ncbi:hypothetical protein HDV00_008061 [Rhizophlyctis rosea]|nr:hypothetical protein HDV00_008061 [Rhizophlyctis rosea]
MSANKNRFALLADDYKPPKDSPPPKKEDPAPFPAEVPEYTAECADPTGTSKQAELSRHDLHLVVYYRRRWDQRVTKQLFLKHRHIARENVLTNPTDVTNPFCVEMIKTGRTAWTVQTQFLGENDREFGSTLPSKRGWEHPVWSFHRAGRTRTVLPVAVTTDTHGVLPEGTKLFIGGYHGEDWIDEDFVIYNDVTIVKPDGTIHVFQYPSSDFPPTDFHTATLIDQKIYIIGSIGYLGHRGTKAQVCVLDLKTLSIQCIRNTTGDDPGWIANHEVVNDPTSDGQITIRIRVPTTTALEDGCTPGRWSFHPSESRWSALPLNDTDTADRNLYQTNLSTHQYDSEYQHKAFQEETQRRRAEHKQWKLDWEVKVRKLVSGWEESLAKFDAQEEEYEKLEQKWEGVLKRTKSGEARDDLAKIREALEGIRERQEEARAALKQWRPCLSLADSSSSDSDSDDSC